MLQFFIFFLFFSASFVTVERTRQWQHVECESILRRTNKHYSWLYEIHIKNVAHSHETHASLAFPSIYFSFLFPSSHCCALRLFWCCTAVERKGIFITRFYIVCVYKIVISPYIPVPGAQMSNEKKKFSWHMENVFLIFSVDFTNVKKHDADVGDEKGIENSLWKDTDRKRPVSTRKKAQTQILIRINVFLAFATRNFFSFQQSWQSFFATLIIINFHKKNCLNFLSVV